MEFTVTRLLMKLYKTGSAAVDSECQNFFSVFAHLEPNWYPHCQVFGKNSWPVIIISVDYSSVMLELA